MIKDLVKYLLRSVFVRVSSVFSTTLKWLDSQGCYSSEGSIVILCTYLGQLARVRDALRAEMTVVIDERDQDALNQLEGEGYEGNEAMVERVHVTERVRIQQRCYI